MKMSYSIIYGRQFVKTTKGIIPMILSGSNNCTEFIQGREVLERNWYPMTLSNKDKRIAIPAEELLLSSKMRFTEEMTLPDAAFFAQKRYSSS